MDPEDKLPPYLKDRRAELYNPLKENRITYTEMRCIDKMKRMGKWDEERDGGPTLKKVDSLVESVYNSEKNLEWLKIADCPVKAPPPSELSDSDFNLYDSVANGSTSREIYDPDWLSGGKKEQLASALSTNTGPEALKGALSEPNGTASAVAITTMGGESIGAIG